MFPFVLFSCRELPASSSPLSCCTRWGPQMVEGITLRCYPRSPGWWKMQCLWFNCVRAHVTWNMFDVSVIAHRLDPVVSCQRLEKPTYWWIESAKRWGRILRFSWNLCLKVTCQANLTSQMFSTNDLRLYPVIELGYEKKSFASSLMTPIFTKRALRIFCKLALCDVTMDMDASFRLLTKAPCFCHISVAGSQFQHFSLRLEQMAKYVDFWTSWSSTGVLDKEMQVWK